MQLFWRRSVFLAFFLLCLGRASAQRIEKFYDLNWKSCTPGDARYYSILTWEDSVWHQQDYYVSSKSMQMNGYFKDTASSMRHGYFRYYYPDGNVQSAGRYANNKKEGVWITLHPNQMIADSVFYKGGLVEGIRMGWHPNGYPSDSAHWTLDGQGTVVSWFSNGNPSSVMLFKAGKPHGTWQFFHSNGRLAAIEKYLEGQPIEKRYYNEEGDLQADTANRSHGAFFGPIPKESGAAWRKFLEKKIYWPQEYLLRNTDRVEVLVSALIDEEGKVSDVRVEVPFHPSFDKIAVRAMESSPRWTPAFEHNRRVAQRIRQTFGFEQKD